MALKTVPNDIPYVSRKRVFINSHTASSNSNADGEEIWDNATFTENLSEPCSDVASIELTGYNVPEFLSSPFPQPQGNGRWPGSRYLDVTVDYGASTVDFTVEMPYIRDEFRIFFDGPRRNVRSTLSEVAISCTEAMRTAGGGGAPWTGLQFIVMDNELFSDDSRGAIVLPCVVLASSPTAYATVTYRFGSGPNSDNSPYKQLGFNQPVDVGGTPVVQADGSTAYWPIPDKLPDVFLQRYANIRIDQVQTHFDPFPHARIFLGPPYDYINTSQRPIERPRLLTNGPKRLIAMTIRLTLNQDRPIDPLCNFGVDLIYDVLQNVPELEPGAWSTQQSLVY